MLLHELVDFPPLNMQSLTQISCVTINEKEIDFQFPSKEFYHSPLRGNFKIIGIGIDSWNIFIRLSNGKTIIEKFLNENTSMNLKVTEVQAYEEITKLACTNAEKVWSVLINPTFYD